MHKETQTTKSRSVLGHHVGVWWGGVWSNCQSSPQQCSMRFELELHPPPPTRRSASTSPVIPVLGSLPPSARMPQDSSTTTRVSRLSPAHPEFGAPGTGPTSLHPSPPALFLHSPIATTDVRLHRSFFPYPDAASLPHHGVGRSVGYSRVFGIPYPAPRHRPDRPTPRPFIRSLHLFRRTEKPGTIYAVCIPGQPRSSTHAGAQKPHPKQ